MSVRTLTPLLALRGAIGVLFRGAWAERDGGPAKLAELDADHDAAALRAERAGVETANAGRERRERRAAGSASPDFQPDPAGFVDVSSHDDVFTARATELEVQVRDIMRNLHRAAVRDAAEFEAALSSYAAARRAHESILTDLIEVDYLGLEGGAAVADYRARLSSPAPPLSGVRRTTEIEKLDFFAASFWEVASKLEALRALLGINTAATA